MLLRALYLTFLLSLMTVTAIAATLFIGKVILFERALAYVPTAYQSGLTTLQASFAPAGIYTPSPQNGVLGCVSNDLPCSVFASEAITIPVQAGPTAAAGCANSATNCALNLQADPHVAEGRLGVQMLITIADRNQNHILTRTKYLTLRTFAVPPYVAVIGERDGAMADRGVSAEGDTAGVPAAPGRDDTQIKVTYHNQTTNSNDTSRNAWTTQGWDSGNAGSAAWSP